jgi:hypothetical protein
MLSVNKPMMKQAFSALIQDNSGVFYKAAYNAYYESVKPSSPSGDVNADQENKLCDESDKAAKDCAEKFAKAFCKELRSGGFDSTLADEIDNHVKSIKLMITTPVLPTVISPMGPCSGSLSIMEETGASIQIL